MKSFKDAQVMKKDKKETLLFQMRADREAWDNLQLLRVILHEEYTKVDFGYAASGYYIKGGWVRIHDCISIDSKTDGKSYKFLEAENIPVYPEQHHFESKRDWKYFTLYFEPLPYKDCVFDIIEQDPNDPNDFNFFDIHLKISEGEKVLELET
jgi:hypothetical protein